MSISRIIYTYTDEAPALATHSLLPVIDAFAGTAGVEVTTSDISLAGRILAVFPDRLREDQRVEDALSQLGDVVESPDANIIKLPNISASIPQLKRAISELQSQGYDVPDYPDEPATPDQQDTRSRYDTVKGSAVNPVLRQGNSDRRAPKAVKEYARRNPHSMGEWSSDSRTHVATMDHGDFRANERSTTVEGDDELRIEFVADDGSVQALKPSVPVRTGDVIDATFMSRRALVSFLSDQVADAAARDVLFSLHLKATMMKVSDPIIFGHTVRTYFAEVFEKHGEVFEQLGVSPRDGMASLASAIEQLPEEQRAAIEADIQAAYASGPDLAMVDSDNGISNLHVPSDVIIDASMPAMIRTSGRMWNPAGDQQDAKATIPDSSYAALYQETIDFCREHGAFDPTTMGTVPNVGLMAQKAEEYGSHDKTFEIEADGAVRVVDGQDAVVFEHRVEAGDIWRMCQTTDAAIRDWVQLALRRARETGMPAIFWLDETRAHDAELITKVNDELGRHDTDELTLDITDVATATRQTLARAKRGEDTISVTGNVLRDYLTDLFPILELGTSAKTLSIVPLMNGGGLFETGAGGSAPRHVQQFVAENHLRWDSLGEFLALAVSLEHHARVGDNPRAAVLSRALDDATERFLVEGRSPSRKAGELDNRGSHYYLSMYWAEALAEQKDDAELATTFATIARELAAAEDTIVGELNGVQGKPVDIGGYFNPDRDTVTAAMRPSPTFNSILAALR